MDFPILLKIKIKLALTHFTSMDSLYFCSVSFKVIGPKKCPKPSTVYMIKNLFSNPKLFTECKNDAIPRFCGYFRADRYTMKKGFSLYKIGGKNATFRPKMCSKSAKNGPKHLKFTPKQHFCEYFQKI